MRVCIFVDDPNEGDLLRPILTHVGLEANVSANLEPALENWPQDLAELVLLAAD